MHISANKFQPFFQTLYFKKYFTVRSLPLKQAAHLLFGNKNPRPPGRGRGFLRCTLLSDNGLGGAVGSAGAAVHAGIGVDDVLRLALGNGLHGAVLRAAAAADAGIGDLMSHE